MTRGSSWLIWNAEIAYDRLFGPLCVPHCSSRRDKRSFEITEICYNSFVVITMNNQIKETSHNIIASVFTSREIRASDLS